MNSLLFGRRSAAEASVGLSTGRVGSRASGRWLILLLGLQICYPAPAHAQSSQLLQQVYAYVARKLTNSPELGAQPLMGERLNVAIVADPHPLVRFPAADCQRRLEAAVQRDLDKLNGGLKDNVLSVARFGD